MHYRHLGLALALGLVIWTVRFAAVWILSAASVYDFDWSRFFTVIFSGLLAFGFTSFLKPDKLFVSFIYTLIWVGMNFVLDALITQNFFEQYLFSRSVFSSYALMLFTPLMWCASRRPRLVRHESIDTWV